jgi:hypothetical protein
MEYARVMRTVINTVYDIKTIALMLHLDRSYDDCRELINDGDYVVYTDKEADDAVFEYIKDSVWSFNPSFLANYIDLPVEDIKQLQKSCEDSNNVFLKLLGDELEDFVYDAICTDGRGHFLSPYDGVESQIDIGTDGADEFTFYIYRCN